MTNKKPSSKQTHLNRSLLIANLSVLWVLIFATFYIWGGIAEKVHYGVTLNSLGESIPFWIKNYLPFILGSIGISYAVFLNSLKANSSKKSIYLTISIILSLVLSFALIISVDGIAYLVR